MSISILFACVFLAASAEMYQLNGFHVATNISQIRGQLKYTGTQKAADVLFTLCACRAGTS
jgi:hypothetical protein